MISFLPHLFKNQKYTNFFCASKSYHIKIALTSIIVDSEFRVVNLKYRVRN